MTRMYGGAPARARVDAAIFVQHRHGFRRRTAAARFRPWCPASAGRPRGQFRRRRLGDDHHGRTQQPAVQGPGRGPGLHHRAGRVRLALLLGHRLVQVGVERLPGRVLALDAVALQDARGSCARRRRGPRAACRRSPAGPARRRRQAVDAAPQVLRRLDHVGGEFLHRVLPGLVDLAAGAGAHVGDLRLGAHPAVLHLRHLGLQFGDAGGGGLHQSVLRQGRVLVGGVHRRRIGLAAGCGVGRRLLGGIVHFFVFGVHGCSVRARTGSGQAGVRAKRVCEAGRFPGGDGAPGNPMGSVKNRLAAIAAGHAGRTASPCSAAARRSALSVWRAMPAADGEFQVDRVVDGQPLGGGERQDRAAPSPSGTGGIGFDRQHVQQAKTLLDRGSGVMRPLRPACSRYVGDFDRPERGNHGAVALHPIEQRVELRAWPRPRSTRRPRPSNPAPARSAPPYQPKLDQPVDQRRPLVAQLPPAQTTRVVPRRSARSLMTASAARSARRLIGRQPGGRPADRGG